MFVNVLTITKCKNWRTPNVKTIFGAQLMHQMYAQCSQLINKPYQIVSQLQSVRHVSACLVSIRQSGKYWSVSINQSSQCYSVSIRSVSVSSVSVNQSVKSVSICASVYLSIGRSGQVRFGQVKSVSVSQVSVSLCQCLSVSNSQFISHCQFQSVLVSVRSV